MANIDSSTSLSTEQSQASRPNLTSRRKNVTKEVTIFTMLAGILAGLIMTIVTAAARSSGFFPFSLERSLGELLLGSQGSAAFAVGLIVHLFASTIFALLYAEGFRRIHAVNTKLGALFGVAQWLVVGSFIGLMPSLRPMLAESLSTAGPFAVNLGVFGFFYLMLAHVLFGAIVGSAILRMSQEYPDILQRRVNVRRFTNEHLST